MKGNRAALTHAVRQTPNPYLRGFNALMAECREGGRNTLQLGAVREAGTDQFGFALPHLESLALLMEERAILEMGAGAGYWGSLIASAARKVSGPCVQIMSFDLNPQAWSHPATGPDAVMQADANTTALYAAEMDASLMSIWPSMDESWSADALRVYHRAGGRRLIYVGEDQYGCTACPDFFRQLDASWVEVDIGSDGDIPRWPTVHDRLRIFDRA